MPVRRTAHVRYTRPPEHTLDINDVVRLSKSTAVIPVSICIRRSEVLQCKQKLGETFRHFSTTIRGAVTDCDFTVLCPPNPSSARAAPLRTAWR